MLVLKKFIDLVTTNCFGIIDVLNIFAKVFLWQKS